MAEPTFIATWLFGQTACEAAWKVLATGGSALDAVETGGNAVEEDPAVASVGYGGLPNAEGVVELDAAIMDAETHSAGAVAALTGIRRPISVARRVMEQTAHVMLAGNNARRFALQQGFPQAELLTPAAHERWHAWHASQTGAKSAHFDMEVGHDTVGLCALDLAGRLSSGCTTSGLAWKVPGRVGDSPIVGSGLYAARGVGAAAATGNGDEIMRACLSFRVVGNMERGLDVQAACEEAIRYLVSVRPAAPRMEAACIGLAVDGSCGAAATEAGFNGDTRRFQYAVVQRGVTHVHEGVYVGM